ncbi:MAG TPA: DUF2269 family protein [Candidatus Limnocylindrales bacterium]|nr:DUF2269 family protein [Candidatus Limnocylindrales bacterium]
MYQGLVFLHLVGVLVFAIAHGVSIFAAFRVRGERDPKVVAAILGLSKIAVGLLYVGLLLLGIGGLGAAWSAGTLLAPWAIASYVVLVVVLGVMYALATPYYVKVRELVGDGTAAVDPVELERMLATRRPEILAGVGAIGLLVLVWLMVYRPG